MQQTKRKLMFITLTVRGKPSDRLSSMLDRLKNAWKELRRMTGWKNHIAGGVIMTEIKWSATSGGHWHPHYHIIAEGKWLDEKWLRDAWQLLTRDSKECDVSRIDEPGKALSYVTKYASKPLDSSFTMKSHLLDEAMHAMKGVRLAACFGEWHGTPLLEKVQDDDETECLTTWCYEGTTDDLAIRAARGEAKAKQLLQAVERLQRLRHTLNQRCRGSPPHDVLA
jgi:hypothetical protein